MVKYLPTTKTHLPKGYPLPSKQEAARFKPIFDLAFKIHEVAHDFKKTKYVTKSGVSYPLGPTRGVLTMVVSAKEEYSKQRYCDCYERAYQAVHKNVLSPTYQSDWKAEDGRLLSAAD
ncbi:MAG: hypothetical protein KGL39_14055 [Patescibacteria group bacterium]|nr:hypothetical protein [Patescibacteria group bacterium]